MSPDIFEQTRPDIRRFSLVFKEPTLRPPVLDEMMPDLERLILSVAQRFSDQTTPHLHVDEMVGEGRYKLAELIDRGELNRQRTRSDFFKFFKASINNQARSRVQKYRFTEKRTGVKPPPREQRFAATAKSPDKTTDHDEDEHPHVDYHKSVELSIDDPNINLQVSYDQSVSDGGSTREVVDEYEALFTDFEKMVFRQMIEPNSYAWCFALEDSYLHKKPGKTSIKIRHEHMAKGIGIEPEDFENAVLSIREKITNYRNMTEEEQQDQARRNAVIAQLKEVFGLQIPPIADEILIRRLFTLAARDQYTKVNTQVAEMLDEIGAKIPVSHGHELSCYGVLYQKNNRICNSCGLRFSCATEAANVGLAKITISPKLLGARQIRVPAIFPTIDDGTPSDVIAANPRDAEIISYLEETFRKTIFKGETWFSARESDTKDRRFLLSIGKHQIPLKVRFCHPSDTLKEKLEGASHNTWFAPDDLNAKDVIALIDQHAKEFCDADADHSHGKACKSSS